MSTGAPSPEQTIRAAAQWYARLCSDDASATDHAAHAAWLAENPEHRQIWQRVQRLQQQMSGAASQGTLGSATLLRAHEQRTGRRALLRRGGLMALAGIGLAGSWHMQPWQRWLHDASTSNGERQLVRLEDGTEILLGSKTLLDLDLDGPQRRILLHRGEIMVTTGKLAKQSPAAQVVTRQGAIVPLGTRFVARRTGDITDIDVLEQRVELVPAQAGAARLIVASGERGRLGPDGARRIPQERGRVMADDWTRGLLVVDDWSLADFITELQRHHRGHLSVAPEAANLRLSGAFSIEDTQRTLTALENTLPIRLSGMPGLWTRIQATRMR